MTTGTVKWFNRARGYGFIEPEDGSKDAFVHISAVQRAGMASLDEGQKLEYELVEGENGKTSAENLVDLGGGDAPAAEADAAPSSDADEGTDAGDADVAEDAEASEDAEAAEDVEAAEEADDAEEAEKTVAPEEEAEPSDSGDSDDA